MTYLDEGVWDVFTETSHYRLDLDNRVLIRYPGDGDGSDPAEAFPAVVSELRHDAEPIPLIEVLCLEVGIPGEFVIAHKPGRSTYRRTTNVRRIERV